MAHCHGPSRLEAGKQRHKVTFPILLPPLAGELSVLCASGSEAGHGATHAVIRPATGFTAATDAAAAAIRGRGWGHMTAAAASAGPRAA